MSVIVQKFGGTSVADPGRLARCAERAATAFRTGHRVVVVVSAMGDTTNRLMSLAKSMTPAPDPREMDVLLVTGEQTTAALMTMAIQRLGVPAISLSNWQTGIKTDASHGRARIEAVEVSEIRKLLDAGRVAVVAGWTGTTASGDVATLGRGGSDITAVALAAALNITDHHGLCEIYTDVAGVFTADPQIVPDARCHREISYSAMIELAERGAKVLHPRAAIIGQRYGVPIHVRDSLKSAEIPGCPHHAGRATGTVVRANLSRTGQFVGCALLNDLARISVIGVDDTGRVLTAIREAFASANLQAIDLRSSHATSAQRHRQVGHGPGASYVKFTIRSTELQDALAVIDWIRAEHPGCDRQVELGLCQVAVVADGPMVDHQRIQSRCRRSLQEAIDREPGCCIECEMTETTLIWTLPAEDGRSALIALHEACGPADRIGGSEAPHAAVAMLAS